MKLRIILGAMLVIMMTAGLSTNADANPWRHGYCRPAVRYCPPVRVYAAPACGYYGPAYCPPVHYAPRVYGYNRGYGHAYHR